MTERRLVLVQKGFSLLELLIAIILIGVLTVAASPFMSQAVALHENAYRLTQKNIDAELGAGLLRYAQNDTTSGAVPSPYTGGGYFSTVADPSNTALTNLLESTTGGQAVNDDGTAAQNMRVYQLVSGLTTTSPLYGTAGPVVTLTYQFGAIYTTDCPFGSGCNATPRPGASPTLTASNYSTFQVVAPDTGGYLFSTLNLQEDKLARTAQHLGKIAQMLEEVKSALEEQNAITSTNYFPAPSGSGAPNDSGANPVTNQGCHDGWYNLDAANVNVLQQMGLSQSDYGVTAWGGTVEYCRNYDPTGTTSTGTTPPYYGALRINKDVSAGLSPDGTTASNNVFITF